MEPVVVRPANWCRYEYKTCPEGCPLTAAEGRLREAHRRWHECLDEYQSPDDFRAALNSAIQALRNFTFVLQAVKREVPGFDDWYAQEQAAMRADRVLRWVVDARNTIVKQGDLATHSWLRVSVVLDYEDEAEAVRLDQLAGEELLDGRLQEVTPTVVSAPVASSPADVFRTLDRLRLPLRVRQDAAMLLERRWVAEDMPSEELLTLLAYAYGRLRGVLSRCHALLGLEVARVAISYGRGDAPSGSTEPEWLTELPHGGRHPCMVTSRDKRTKRYRLADGTEVTEFVTKEMLPDPDVTSERLTEAYGSIPKLSRDGIGTLQTKEELTAFIEWCGRVGARILDSGQEHGWFTMHFRQGRGVGTRVHMTTDAQGKQAIASEIARIALELEADLVVVLGEVWVSPMDRTVDGAYQPPSRHPERSEALLAYAAAKSGAEANLMLPFEHISGEPPERVVEVGEARWDEAHSLGLLMPTRSAWGLEAKPRRAGESFFKRPR